MANPPKLNLKQYEFMLLKPRQIQEDKGSLNFIQNTNASFSLNIDSWSPRISKEMPKTPSSALNLIDDLIRNQNNE